MLVCINRTKHGEKPEANVILLNVGSMGSTFDDLAVKCHTDWSLYKVDFVQKWHVEQPLHVSMSTAIRFFV